jgi:uncharacterized membrane protein (UPF0127 family)
MSLIALSIGLFFLFNGALACRTHPSVVILGKDHGELTLKVEIADTPAKRALGLQYRRDLEDDQGMLFLFPDEKVRAFWMKNTPLSLDLIFIGSRRRVAGIIHRAIPFSTASLSVSAPSQFVLEVNGGLSKRWGIEVGDHVGFKGVSVESVRE